MYEGVYIQTTLSVHLHQLGHPQIRWGFRYAGWLKLFRTWVI